MAAPKAKEDALEFTEGDGPTSTKTEEAKTEEKPEAGSPKYDGPTKLFINNEWVDSVSGKTMKTFNPANEELIAEVAEADKADVDIAVKAARAAFNNPEWRDMSKNKRSDLLYKLAQLMERDAKKIALWESVDNGKAAIIAGMVDVPGAIRAYKYYAGWADKLNGKTMALGDPGMKGERGFSYTLHEPVGVVGCIIPWNFPLLMQAWKLGPALATGCTVVMKLSEKTPLTGLMIAALIKEAGFPAGVVNIINGYGPSAGAALAEHLDVDKIAFTGSTATGQKIQIAAAVNLKRVTLECGGKSPLVVCNDADIEKTCAIVANGIWFNTGQVCCASSRVLVQEDIYPKFVEAMVANAKTAAAQTGNPLTVDGSVLYGPIVDKIQFDRVMGYIETGKNEDKAKLLCGGVRKGDKGFFIEPTIFGGVTNNMRIAREEIFGPVLSLITFKDDEEAIRIANDTCYGLAAGVCSQNFARATKLARRLRAGSVWVNKWGTVDCDQPFGGYKMSGSGRESGAYALANFTEVKVVDCDLGTL